MLTIMKYGKLLHQEGISNVEVNAGIVSEVLSSSNGTYTHMLARQYVYPKTAGSVFKWDRLPLMLS
jgi:hypothetical protein